MRLERRAWRLHLQVKFHVSSFMGLPSVLLSGQRFSCSPDTDTHDTDSRPDRAGLGEHVGNVVVRFDKQESLALLIYFSSFPAAIHSVLTCAGLLLRDSPPPHGDLLWLDVG